jgi:hypothetical protein
VCVVRRDGSGRRVLFRGDFSSAQEPDEVTVVWSPDSQKVAFIRICAENPAEGCGRSLYTVAANGKGTPRLVSTSFVEGSDVRWGNSHRISYFSGPTIAK